MEASVADLGLPVDAEEHNFKLSSLTAYNVFILCGQQFVLTEYSTQLAKSLGKKEMSRHLICRRRGKDFTQLFA